MAFYQVFINTTNDLDLIIHFAVLFLSPIRTSFLACGLNDLNFAYQYICVNEIYRSLFIMMFVVSVISNGDDKKSDSFFGHHT